MTGGASKTVNVFCSYASEDAELFQGLLAHLKPLLNQRTISLHHNQDVLAGNKTRQVLAQLIKAADLILLLISRHSLASDDCYYDIEAAIERHQAEETPVIPVLLRPYDLSGTPLEGIRLLPSNGKAIVDWDDHDRAFIDIVKGIRQVIATLQAATSQEEVPTDITRINADSPALFTEYFVGNDRLAHRFPSETDFENHLVYLSRDYAEEVELHLHTKRRATLVGLAASGKTVLALAFARELQRLHHYRIAYKDLSISHNGSGQQWYEVMRVPHRENTLYILDNCHLAEEEVTAFCNQWNSNPPLQALCLLLSRAEPQQIKRLTSSQDDGEQGYEYLSFLELWRDEIIHIQSGLTYMEILKQYYDAYRQHHASLYEDPSSDDLLTLKKQHAHNLVTSHFRLVAWKKRGGFLSKVKQEEIYESVYERYLSDRHATLIHTLPVLCALHSFEIPVHSSFIATLPPEEVQLLQERDMLTSRRVDPHGKLYTLAMHPQEAQLIFAASLIDNGAVTPKAIEDGLFTVLRVYLLTMPKNYLEVYARLCRYRARTILQRLLTDAQLQAHADQQFVQGRLISDESVGTISKIVEYMRSVQYDAAQVQRFIEALDIEQIIQHAITQRRSSPQQLFWLLRSLQKISPPAAVRFMEDLTPATLAQLCLQQKPAIALISQFSKVMPGMWQSLLVSIGAQELAAIYNRSPLGAVGAFLRYHSGYAVVQQSYTLFEEAFLRGKLVRSPLSEIGKYLHRVRTIPTQGITPAHDAIRLLLSVDLSERIATTDLEPFALLLQEIASLDASHAAQFLQPLHIPEITHAAFENSGLRGIQLLIHNVGRIDASILSSILQELQTLPLQAKLLNTPLIDCSYFLWNVYVLLDPQLAQHYCQLLDEQDMSQLLAETPLEQLCHFLLNLYSLSGQSSLHIFAEPVLEERLQQAWELETGYATVLLGLLSLTQPQRQRHLPELHAKEQYKQLEEWLRWPTEQQAYQLALSIYALRTWNEQEARQLLHRYLPYTRAIKMLRHGRANARTPRIIALVENEYQWLTAMEKPFE